jgi:pentose-5-phosphate-3-epimerase
MSTPRHAIPDWVTRGKTIRQLIAELESFEDQDLTVRMSIDDGLTDRGISIVQKQDNRCVLVNSEIYYQTDWQDSMDREKPDGGD